MKYKDITTKEDEENRIIRINMTPENWEENELLLKETGNFIEYPEVITLDIEVNKYD